VSRGGSQGDLAQGLSERESQLSIATLWKKLIQRASLNYISCCLNKWQSRLSSSPPLLLFLIASVCLSVYLFYLYIRFPLSHSFLIFFIRSIKASPTLREKQKMRTLYDYINVARRFVPRSSASATSRAKTSFK